MDEFEKRKREVLQPIFFEAGAGLYDCQGFEYSVAYLLFLLSRLGVPGLNPADTMAILDHEAKKTAGQLVALLRQRTTLSDGIEEALEPISVGRKHKVRRLGGRVKKLWFRRSGLLVVAHGTDLAYRQLEVD